MIYYRNNGGVIEKYDVIFNREELELFKNKIIKDCSVIEHKEFTSDCVINDMDKRLIKNFRFSKVSLEDCLDENRKLYSYSYDQYNPPYLVTIIDKILNNDVKALDELYKYDASIEMNINRRIRKVNQELYDININDIEEKKHKLKELEELLSVKELNENQLSVSLYYPRVLNMIRFNLVDSILLDDLNRFNKFLGTNLEFEDIIGEVPATAFKKTLSK